MKNEKKKVSDYKNSKKALIVVAGNWRFYQAIYFTYIYPEFQWDIVVLRYGEDLSVVDKIVEYSKCSQRFHNIYIAITPSQFTNIFALIKEVISMCCYYALGQKKQYCKNILLKYIDSLDYDLVCVACGQSLFEGALINFSDEICTVIMEEGMSDYIETSTQYSLLKRIVAKILFKMCYINLFGDCGFALYRNCIKYVRFPQKIRKNYYKEVRRLFDFTELGVLDEFIEKISELFRLDEEEYQLIFFSSPLWEYRLEIFYSRVEEYVYEQYANRNILIKRHPQDGFAYNFKGTNVEEKYCDVPGEIIVRKWNDSILLFTFPSTILLEAMQMNTKCKIIYFKDGKDDSYHKNFWKAIEMLKFPKDQILYL